jgi:hypothetical protein
MFIIPCFEDYVFEKSSLDITVNNETDNNGNIFKINITDEDGTPKTYSVTNDKIMLIKDDKSEEEVTDETLKKTIIRAVRNIKNVKKEIKYSYVDRVINDCSDELEDEMYDDIETGKLNTNITNSLKKILGDNLENDFDCMHLNILPRPTPNEGIKIPEDLQQTLEKWFKKSLHTIGKGEFLLPIIFNDVKKVNKNDKGDDIIVENGGDNINIEVKTAGSGFKFKHEYIGTSNETPEEKLKKNCLKSLLTYAISRNLNKQKLYLLIFDNKFKDGKTSNKNVNTTKTTTQEDENKNGDDKFNSCLIINCGNTRSPRDNYFIEEIDSGVQTLYKNINTEIKECKKKYKSDQTDFFIEYDGKSNTLVFYIGKDKIKKTKENKDDEVHEGNQQVKKYREFIND